MTGPDGTPPSAAEVVDAVARARRTVKMESASPAPVSGSYSRGEIEAVLATAGFAPFHHEAADLRDPRGGGARPAAEPWRCHLLDAPACRWLRERALEEGVGGRVPRLLGAASALALVTWRPEGASVPGPRVGFEGTLTNMEHVAAGGAMIQTALLAATARGIPTYWSSGGWLATAEGLGAVGVPGGRVLLGAVFFFPSSLAGAAVAAGKHRDRRSPPGAWSRWVEAPDVGEPAADDGPAPPTSAP